MNEIVFEIAQDADGGFTAEAIGESIFTQADTWEELRTNVREGVQAFFLTRLLPALSACALCATKCSPSHEAAA